MMRMFAAVILSTACLVVALLGMSVPLQAETLDDASIRALYATLEGDMPDRSKALRHMRERLAETYALNATQNVIFAGMPPQRSQISLNREDTISHAQKGYDSLRIESIKYEIYDIRYAPDRNIAYVRQTMRSSGTLVMPENVMSAGISIPAPRFQGVDKCQESLTLVGNTIKYLQTACDSQMMIQ